MTNADMAKAYLLQAGEILEEAKELKRRGVWNLVVRRSQEVVELSLKSALRGIGIETQKMHDVGSLLRVHQGKFPVPFRRQVGKLAAISRRLRHGAGGQLLRGRGDGDRAPGPL